MTIRLLDIVRAQFTPDPTNINTMPFLGSEVAIVSSGFTGNLDASVRTTQQLANAVDALTIMAGGGGGNFDGNLTGSLVQTGDRITINSDAVRDEPMYIIFDRGNETNAEIVWNSVSNRFQLVDGQGTGTILTHNSGVDEYPSGLQRVADLPELPPNLTGAVAQQNKFVRANANASAYELVDAPTELPVLTGIASQRQKYVTTDVGGTNYILSDAPSGGGTIGNTVTGSFNVTGSRITLLSASTQPESAGAQIVFNRGSSVSYGDAAIQWNETDREFKIQVPQAATGAGRNTYTLLHSGSPTSDFPFTNTPLPSFPDQSVTRTNYYLQYNSSSVLQWTQDRSYLIPVPRGSQDSLAFLQANAAGDNTRWTPPSAVRSEIGAAACITGGDNTLTSTSHAIQVNKYNIIQQSAGTSFTLNNTSLGGIGDRLAIVSAQTNTSNITINIQASPTFTAFVLQPGDIIWFDKCRHTPQDTTGRWLPEALLRKALPTGGGGTAFTFPTRQITETTINDLDQFLVRDVSASADSYITLQDLKDEIGEISWPTGALDENTITNTDRFLVYDSSDSTNRNKYITLQNLKDEIGTGGGGTAFSWPTGFLDESTIEDADRFLVYDNSDTTERNKYITLQNLKDELVQEWPDTQITALDVSDQITIRDATDSTNKHTSLSTLRGFFFPSTQLTSFENTDRMIVRDSTDSTEKYANMSDIRDFIGSINFPTAKLTTLSNTDRMIIRTAAGTTDMYTDLTDLHNFFDSTSSNVLTPAMQILGNRLVDNVTTTTDLLRKPGMLRSIEVIISNPATREGTLHADGDNTGITWNAIDTFTNSGTGNLVGWGNGRANYEFHLVGLVGSALISAANAPILQFHHDGTGVSTLIQNNSAGNLVFRRPGSGVGTNVAANDIQLVQRADNNQALRLDNNDQLIFEPFIELNAIAFVIWFYDASAAVGSRLIRCNDIYFAHFADGAPPGFRNYSQAEADQALRVFSLNTLHAHHDGDLKGIKIAKHSGYVHHSGQTDTLAAIVDGNWTDPVAWRTRYKISETVDNLTYNGDIGFNGNVTATNITATGNLTVRGDLTVEGTTTTEHHVDLEIRDTKITLNADLTVAPTENAQILVNRGTEADVDIRYNETDNKWQFTNDGTNYVGFNEGKSTDLSDMPSVADIAAEVGNRNYFLQLKSDESGYEIGRIIPENLINWFPNFIHSKLSVSTNRITGRNSLSSVALTAVSPSILLSNISNEADVNVRIQWQSYNSNTILETTGAAIHGLVATTAGTNVSALNANQYISREFGDTTLYVARTSTEILVAVHISSGFASSGTISHFIGRGVPYDPIALPSQSERTAGTAGQVLALKSDKTGYELQDASSGGGGSTSTKLFSRQSVRIDNGNNFKELAPVLPETINDDAWIEINIALDRGSAVFILIPGSTWNNRTNATTSTNAFTTSVRLAIGKTYVPSAVSNIFLAGTATRKLLIHGEIYTGETNVTDLKIEIHPGS